MSLYDWDKLLRQWEVEAITIEQAIGQLLLWASDADETLKKVSEEVERLQRQNLTLIGQVKTLGGKDEDEEVMG